MILIIHFNINELKKKDINNVTTINVLLNS